MLGRRLAAQAPVWARAAGVRSASELTVAPEWKAGVAKPAKQSEDGITIVKPGQAFVGDLRSTSGLELGDGIMDHTRKWLQVCAGLEVLAAALKAAFSNNSAAAAPPWLC
jgi:hypothetical protein